MGLRCQLHDGASAMRKLAHTGAGRGFGETVVCAATRGAQQNRCEFGDTLGHTPKTETGPRDRERGRRELARNENAYLT